MARLDFASFPWRPDLVPDNRICACNKSSPASPPACTSSPWTFELCNRRRSAKVGRAVRPATGRFLGHAFQAQPIMAENICSLARYVAAQTAVAWDNAGQAILAQPRRQRQPARLPCQSFLAVDEMLRRAASLVEGMTIDREQIARNLERCYGPFAATERVLLAAVRQGLTAKRRTNGYAKRALGLGGSATRADNPARRAGGRRQTDRRLLALS